MPGIALAAATSSGSSRIATRGGMLTGIRSTGSLNAQAGLRDTAVFRGLAVGPGGGAVGGAQAAETFVPSVIHPARSSASESCRHPSACPGDAQTRGPDTLGGRTIGKCCLAQTCAVSFDFVQTHFSLASRKWGFSIAGSSAFKFRCSGVGHAMGGFKWSSGVSPWRNCMPW